MGKQFLKQSTLVTIYSWVIFNTCANIYTVILTFLQITMHNLLQ